ncbi:hypothetical protein [Polyangium mundeleinium]|uniref:Uncharacterized protein n=1 Tax=Polyangium mundeleinium TaxID=2995306 RepID=A0ABT5EHQ1_9BACT|nr:hypothetical protein [Polyangium mundeleinium]MDC0741343.1 hypothetical protein [Polyangium mundeleinium]
MRRPWNRLLSTALAGALVALTTPAAARPEDPAPSAPLPVPAREDTTIIIEDKPSAPPRAALRPTPTAPAPAPKEPPPARAPTVPYSLGLLGLGAAFVVTGGVLMGVAATHVERCGVAGCYDVLDPKLAFIGQLVLAGGIGMSLTAGTAAAVGLVADRRPGPRRSDHFTEMGIFAVALGAGLAGVSLASAMAHDEHLDGLPAPFVPRALAFALASTAAGLGFWIYGGRDAPSSTAASLRVGPTSAHFTVHY